MSSVPKTRVVKVSVSGGGQAARIDFDLPPVRGTGVLIDRGAGRHTGALAMVVPPLVATAFGVLELPAPGRELSFAAVIGAKFPPPGIQLGFGFAVSGIGGVIGVDRRVDRDALMRAVADGSVAHLFFPSDPVRAGEPALAALGAIFPIGPGSVVAGPMFELSWGRQLVTGSIAVLVEVSDQARLSVLGNVVVAVPDPTVPLILIRADFAGQVDPGEPSVSFLASLTGSHLAGMPFSGDLFLLARGGDDATFVLSGGGFHPAFPVPRGIPPLRRLRLDMSASPLLQLRCEAYLAVTSNTVQFGARVELSAQVAGCGLRGHLQLDVLVQWWPYLYFSADLSVSIAVRVLGETLAGIHLELHLEGPTQWRARGRGSVDLFFFSVAFDFDEQWGTPHPLPAAPPDVDAVATALEQAFRARDAWVVHRPATAPPGVRLTRAADRRLGEGAVVDPYGSVTARQRAVPLGARVERFDRLPLREAQHWDITAARLGAPSAPAGLAEWVTEQFAPGQFLALTDDEQLSQPAFRHFRAGRRLVAGDIVIDPRDNKVADLEYEVKLIVGRTVERFALVDEPFEVDALMLGAVETMAAAASALHAQWWQAPDVRVTVAEETPVAVASAWSLGTPVDAPTALTIVELDAAVADQAGISMVEAWELLG